MERSAGIRSGVLCSPCKIQLTASGRSWEAKRGAGEGGGGGGRGNDWG